MSTSPIQASSSASQSQHTQAAAQTKNAPKLSALPQDTVTLSAAAKAQSAQASATPKEPSGSAANSKPH
jgi:hypothetical protein